MCVDVPGIQTGKREVSLTRENRIRPYQMLDRVKRPGHTIINVREDLNLQPGQIPRIRAAGKNLVAPADSYLQLRHFKSRKRHTEFDGVDGARNLERHRHDKIDRD